MREIGNSLKLPYNSSSLKLIRQIRNEVHRFGITFHRKKEAREPLKTNWKIFPGIGKATADQLLKEFRSVNNIREKELEELTKR